MNNSILPSLIAITPTAQDFLARLEALQSFCNEYFFTEGERPNLKTALKEFADSSPQDTHRESLLSLPEGTLSLLTRENCNQLIEDSIHATSQISTVAITTAIELNSESRNALGYWIKKEIGEQVLMDLTKDSRLIGGCIITWNHQQYDYSLKKMLGEETKKMEQVIHTTLHQADHNVLEPFNGQ